MKLYKAEADTVEVGGRLVHFDRDFRVLLKTQEVLSDEEIVLSDKLLFFQHIFREQLQPTELIEATKAYLDNYIKEKGGERCLSIEQDSDLIYSAFRQAYGIDLHTAELTAGEFMAMLEGLPKGTRLADIIEIRTMELPKPNKYNAEERARILRAKQAVALKGNEDREKSFESFGKSIKMLAEARR